MAKEGMKLVANNKKAYHDYFIEEKYEAGLVLHGTEVKSLRLGKCKLDRQALLKTCTNGSSELLSNLSKPQLC